jgi:heme ABC exporter ATP-binding subunit CcmA
VEVSGLKKSFGYHRVLTGVAFSLRPGEQLSVMGRNGCGKTTLINILATLLNPSDGKVRINGRDIQKHSQAVRRSQGYVGHSSLLYSALTVRENLRFYGRMFSVPSLEERIEELIACLELQKWQDRRVSDLSRGIQQRTSIARGIIHKPLILLLDEPESGLDPVSLVRLQKILADFKIRGGTIIATSHNMEFSLKTGDRIAVLNNGKFEMEAGCREVPVGELKASISARLDNQV